MDTNGDTFDQETEEIIKEHLITEAINSRRALMRLVEMIASHCLSNR